MTVFLGMYSVSVKSSCFRINSIGSSEKSCMSLSDTIMIGITV